jgi:hypothetical protein
MDYHNWAPLFEVFRGLGSMVFLFLPQFEFLRETAPWLLVFLGGYAIFTFAVGIWAKSKEPNRKLAVN